MVGREISGDDGGGREGDATVEKTSLSVRFGGCRQPSKHKGHDGH